ncbi:MAG: hypothetical protein JST00_32950 [Deltaproteobacteria bacterium]|nr:hypothetical protein [Deltaproteobacteria bacterium]
MRALRLTSLRGAFVVALAGMALAVACSSFSDDPGASADAGGAETSTLTPEASVDDRAVPPVDGGLDGGQGSPCDGFVDATFCDDFSGKDLNRARWTPYFFSLLPDGGTGPVGSVGLADVGLGPPGIEAVLPRGIDNGASALRLTQAFTKRIRVRADFRVAERGDAASDYVTLISLAIPTQPPIAVSVDVNPSTKKSYLKVVNQQAGGNLADAELGMAFEAWGAAELDVSLETPIVVKATVGSGAGAIEKNVTLNLMNDPPAKMVTVFGGISQASSKGGPTRVHMDNFALWAE